MSATKCKKVFPGGNTTEGFFSYYDYIIKPDANRFFILKGGPGVGKSSFMKKIGRIMLEHGYSIEEHYCSSSNDSLDAVVITELNVALVDGTSPHMVDPKNPGAVDEIINLGEFWNVNELVKTKKQSMACNKNVGDCFRRAYRYLNALHSIIKDIEVIYQEGMDQYRYYQMEEQLLRDIFDNIQKYEKIGFSRHLFGSAITPGGVVDYAETVVGDMGNIYYMKGNWGTGRSELLERIAIKASTMGYDVEIYHTPFSPKSIEDIVIPGLNLAITTKEKFIDNCTCVVDLDALVSEEVIGKYKDELEFDRKQYQVLLSKSIEYINKAKLFHDELESYYIPCMNFNDINEKRKEIVDRIFQYAKTEK